MFGRSDSVGSLAGSIVFGGLGGLLSVIRRVRSEPERSVKALELETLPIWSVALGPLVGGLAAVLLYMLFRSGLLTGGLFPNFPLEKSGPYSETLVTIKGFDEAKLLVWSFFSGFSEQFVTEILDWLGNKTPLRRPLARSDAVLTEATDRPSKRSLGKHNSRHEPTNKEGTE
jgi:hypothetical protein